MFSPKQSDIYYNDETKEMFVCTVSSISAERCESNTTVYGALPLIYKINKNDNYKKLVYPKNLSTFDTDSNSDIFNLTPVCAVTGTNFNSITKPLINYNKTTERYSVTFLGKYVTDIEGLSLNNYIFQDIDSDFHLLDAKVYIPKDKDVTADTFTFEDGHISSDLYVAGNTVRNSRPSWFNPAGREMERSTDYQIAPMHVQATSALGFNLILDEANTAIDSVTGNKAFPFMYSGGFISYNPKYTAYDPNYTIRVDFRARSFNVPSPTAYGSSQSVGTSATRWIQQYTDSTTTKHAGPGEGFCVSFFKNPPVSSYVIPNGIGSTLGYAKAGFSPNEVTGTAHTTDGLYIHNNWSPNIGHHNIGAGKVGRLGPAESFIGIGFDVAGDFATTSEEKPGWYSGSTSWTTTPCSVAVRGSSYYDTQVLTAIEMNTVAASAVPMHTSAADAEFVDYRIDLSNKGTKVTIYNKLTSATDYNTILEYRLNKTVKSAGVAGVGNVGIGNVGDPDSGAPTGATYNPWYGIQTESKLPLLNVGLSFTTSASASQFELHKFEVTGVVVSNPWEVKVEEEQTPQTTQKIDNIKESSKNLREKLLNVESSDLVDVDMVIPARAIIADSVNEATNKPQITLCDGSNPDVIEDDVDIKITKIRPEQIDKTIEVAERGEIPKLPGSATTIKRDHDHYINDELLEAFLEKNNITVKGNKKGVGDRTVETISTESNDDGVVVEEIVRWSSVLECRAHSVPAVNYEVKPKLFHTGRVAWAKIDDSHRRNDDGSTKGYNIWFQAIIIDEFIESDDHNDWFARSPRRPNETRGREKHDEEKANSLLGALVLGFIEWLTDNQQFKETRHFALQWQAFPAGTQLKKNELLERINPGTNEPYIGNIPENWITNFKNIGFVPLSPEPGNNPIEWNTLNNEYKGDVTTFFGTEWACAAKWDIPEATDDPDGSGDEDPVSTGKAGGSNQEPLPLLSEG